MAGFRSVLLVLLTGGTLGLLPTSPLRPQQDLDLVETRDGISAMRHEVTIAQWQACVADGGCSHHPQRGLGAVSDDYPVTDIGALDAQEFVAWAQNTIDPNLRLPTLEEWYRFSSVAPYRPTKIFTDPRMAWAATYGAEGETDPTLKPGSGFGTNSSGIADVLGNVWEWTSTCVVNIPPEDVARRCPAYFAAGAHEARVSVFVRDPSTGGCATGTPPAHLGLRLVSSQH
jgi:formylglycine-generating enzyme required for sulfatase activity